MKLDLHTHCSEATYLYNPNPTVVGKIVAAVRSKGLDGIGVTDHYNKAYGFKVREIVEQQFGGEIVIIPGQEVDKGKLHVVVLYLPGDKTFRFVAHPGYPKTDDITADIDDSIHGIELHNPTHDDEMDHDEIRSIARKYNLLLLQNSDAHFLSDIGKYHNEITIEELCARVS